MCEQFSQQILIGRGLKPNENICFVLVRYSILREYPLKVGVDCDEVPPVPIPNTVVKLIYVENTWRVTAWEDR